MKRPIKLILIIATLLILFSVPAAIQAAVYHEPFLVVNPYQDVDWQVFNHYKANLHTHTNLSDGRLSPQQVIDSYHSLGYKVLALTDHDSVGLLQPTWPWQDYNRDPHALGMVAVMGNELSYQHHIGSLFNDYYGSKGSDPHQSLKQIGSRGGLAIFCHPGRYNKPDNWSWYKPYFIQHKHLLGLEVFNQGDRYPNDRLLWDNLLTEMMPGRPVWGFSNDDSHREIHVGRNWNTLLLLELNEANVKEALQKGRFYAVYQPGKIPAPGINRIQVTGTSVTIEAANYANISWISQGKVIHQGKTLNYKEIQDLGNYVRAEIIGDGGTVLTNPFGFNYPEK